MISHENPICAVTKSRAILFCFQDGCELPAFACSPDCLLGEGHADHRTAMWSGIEKEVRQLAERSLSKEELQLLERQDKSLRIIQQELKAIQQNHQRAIRQAKKRLQLKDEAQRLIPNKSNNRVTGDDMARFIKGMEANSLFKNKRAVEETMGKWNRLTNGLIEKINVLITAHKQSEDALPNPEQIPNIDQITSKFTADAFNSDSTVIENGVVTVKPACRCYQPVFANEQLIAGQSCEIEVVYGNGGFMIGVATAELRNKADQYEHNDSMCIDYSKMQINVIVRSEFVSPFVGREAGINGINQEFLQILNQQYRSNMKKNQLNHQIITHHQCDIPNHNKF